MEEKKGNNSLLIWSSFLVLTVFWGSSFILIKKALTNLSAFEVANVRLLTAGLALSGLAIFHIRHVPQGKIKYILLVALTGIFCPAYLFCLAQMGLASSVTGVLNALTPAFTFLISLIVFGGKRNNNQIIGLVLGFFGSILLVLVNPKGNFELNGYALFVVGATICYGINANLVKVFLSDVPSLYISTISVTMAGLLTLPHLIFDIFMNPNQQITTGFKALWDVNFFEQQNWSVGAAMLLGILGTALAQLIFNRMLQASSAVFASSITYFIPIVAVGWGIYDGEVLVFQHYIGFALIIFGILILNKNR